MYFYLGVQVRLEPPSVNVTEGDNDTEVCLVVTDIGGGLERDTIYQLRPSTSGSFGIAQGKLPAV